MDKLEYLESERIKLWQKIKEVEQLAISKLSDAEAEAKAASKKVAEYKNRTKEAYESVLTDLKTISAHASVATTAGESVNKSLKESEDLVVALKGFINDAQANKEEMARLLDAAKKLSESMEKINAGVEEETEKLAAMQKAILNSSEIQKRVELIYKTVLERSEKVEDIYHEVYGYTATDSQTDDEVEVKGLKDKLAESYKEIEKKIDFTSTELGRKHEENGKALLQCEKNWTDKLSGLGKEIEALLPKALTAGLSHAYAKKKDDETAEGKGIFKTFIASICGLIIVSFIPFGICIYYINTGIPLQESVERMPRLVFSIIPLYIPILWVAYSASKKLNLSKRLVEEYTHKEVLSKTYEGLAKQVQDLGDNPMSKDLRVKLLYNILDISAENPGKLISDYNKSDHPMMDALDKSILLTNAVNKLVKVPGFKKISALIQKKADKILDEEDRKATAGLAHVGEEKP
jgi:hypothetical protein